VISRCGACRVAHLRREMILNNTNRGLHIFALCCVHILFLQYESTCCECSDNNIRHSTLLTLLHPLFDIQLQNAPLFSKTFHDTAAGHDADEDLRFLYICHAALDIIEEKSTCERVWVVMAV
jgi:hypothetical protein